jgi:hypothetical protein
MLSNATLFIFNVIILTATSSPLQAAKVYKWIDEDGKTHYGDRTELQARDPQEVRIMKPPATDPSITSRQHRTEQLLKSYQKERSEKSARKEQAAAEKQDREAECLAAQNSKQKFERASSIYTLDDQGNRVYLSDEERTAAISEANQAIARLCD